MANRHGRRCRGLRHALHAVLADLPQRLERERLPCVFQPRLDLGLGEAGQHVGHPGGAAVAPVAAAEIAHHPPARLGDQLGAGRGRRLRAHVPQCVGLGDEPVKLLGRAGPHRVLEHRQSQVEARYQIRNGLVGTVAEIVLKHVPQVGEPNPPLAECLAVSFLRR